MTPQEQAAVDAACAALHALVRAHELGALEVLVRADGRVDIRAETPRGYHAWTVHAGLDGPRPGAALAERRRST